MELNKCCYTNIWDTKQKMYRQCKRNKSYKDYCIYHVKKVLNIYIIKIQSFYRAYYIRKKLKIYYKLPREIQRKIIWHINEKIYENAVEFGVDLSTPIVHNSIS